jgi:hypothetical protein
MSQSSFDNPLPFLTFTHIPCGGNLQLVPFHERQVVYGLALPLFDEKSLPKKLVVVEITAQRVPFDFAL